MVCAFEVEGDEVSIPSDGVSDGIAMPPNSCTREFMPRKQGAPCTHTSFIRMNDVCVQGARVLGAHLHGIGCMRAHAKALRKASNIFCRSDRVRRAHALAGALQHSEGVPT